MRMGPSATEEAAEESFRCFVAPSPFPTEKAVDV